MRQKYDNSIGSIIHESSPTHTTGRKRLAGQTNSDLATRTLQRINSICQIESLGRPLSAPTSLPKAAMCVLVAIGTEVNFRPTSAGSEAQPSQIIGWPTKQARDLVQQARWTNRSIIGLVWPVLSCPVLSCPVLSTSRQPAPLQANSPDRSSPEQQMSEYCTGRYEQDVSTTCPSHCYTDGRFTSSISSLLHSCSCAEEPTTRMTLR